MLGSPCGAQTPADPVKPAPSTAAASAAQPSAADEDDDAVLRPVEPDFTVINLPTTLPLPVGKGNFHLSHRFNGNLRLGDFGDQLSSLFGIDEGANVGLEFRYGVMRHLEAIVARTNVDRDVQFSAKYDAFHQSASRPIGVSAIVSIEGTNNFKDHHQPALGVVLSRAFADKVAVYGMPMWVHNTPTVGTQDTFFVGLGGLARVLSTVYLTGEVMPRVSGYVIGDAEYGFGIEKRVGGHVFQLTFTNSAATMFGQLARGGFPQSLYLGFNLARKFY